MGQRTQLIVNITHRNKTDTESKAYHNQRGFGRPTITAALAVAEYMIKEYNEAIERDEKKPFYSGLYLDFTTLWHIICRPFGWDEYFRRHEPYDCSPFPDPNEHDNNDGYAVVNIDCNKMTVTCAVYDSNCVPKTIDQYLKETGAESYCSPKRYGWKEERLHMLRNYKAPSFD